MTCFAVRNNDISDNFSECLWDFAAGLLRTIVNIWLVLVHNWSDPLYTYNVVALVTFSLEKRDRYVRLFLRHGRFLQASPFENFFWVGIFKRIRKNSQQLIFITAKINVVPRSLSFVTKVNSTGCGIGNKIDSSAWVGWPVPTVTEQNESDNWKLGSRRLRHCLSLIEGFAMIFALKACRGPEGGTLGRYRPPIALTATLRPRVDAREVGKTTGWHYLTNGPHRPGIFLSAC